jgi:small-conductance mechanosensitive channel
MPRIAVLIVLLVGFVSLAQGQAGPAARAPSSAGAAANADGDGDGAGTVRISIEAAGVKRVTVDGEPVSGGAAAGDGRGAGVEGGPGPDAGEAGRDGPATGALDVLKTLQGALGELGQSFLRNLPELVIAVLLVIATAILARVVHNVSRRLFSQLKLRGSLGDLFAQLIYIGVWIVGLTAAAMVVFPGFGLGQIVATAGLASIAIGFAFKDIFENFFAGILILWRFPFEKGDFIEIEGQDVEGSVEDIWIRMTLIRKTTGELVLVPNATVYKNPVRVLTDRTYRRVSITCGVAYGEDVTEARRVIEEAVRRCRTVREDQPVQIFLEGFGSSSMDFEVTWWTGSRPVEQRESRHEVVEAVKRALDAAGIEIPYPYRTLTFTANEPLIYESLRGGGEGGGGGGGQGSGA